MAQKVIVTLTDDLDGTPDTEDEKVETVSFALGKHSGEIDLCPANRLKLRELLAPYFEHGRPASAEYRRGVTSVSGHASHTRPSRNRGSRERTADIRAWARSKGYPIGDKGRIPRQMEEEYHAEHRTSL